MSAIRTFTRKRWLTIALAALLLAVAATFLTNGEEQAGILATDKIMVETTAGIRHSFTVEIADTPATQRMGLMFRDKMADDRGMLFLFAGAPQELRFWMKNTYIPLDMIFIAPDGTVRKVHANAVPQSLAHISSETPVVAVLEINGGLSQRLGITSGARILHPYFKN